MYKDGTMGEVSDTNPLSDIIKARDNEARVIERRTKEECVKALYEKYKTHYEILSDKVVLKGGFLGLGQKEFYQVRYIVRPPEVTPKQSFEDSRKAILERNGADSKTYRQAVIIDEKIEDVKRLLEEKLSNLQIPVEGKHPSIVKIENLLTQNEFSLSFINSITRRLRSELSAESLDDYESVQKTVFGWIGDSIQIRNIRPMRPPHVVILVGPTGVGKTTTIAKLAGQLIVEAQNKGQPLPNVRMITIDNTRVGAEDQLRKLAKIMDIPLDNAKSAAEVKQIFDDYKKSLDVLFIDTPGFSPNDFANIGKMREILGIPGMNKDVYLAITASVKASDLVSIIKVYEQFDYESVIITKWDETSAVGNVLSVLAEKQKSIAYITNGQRVPREIKRASKVECLRKLNGFSVDKEHFEEMFDEESGDEN